MSGAPRARFLRREPAESVTRTGEGDHDEDMSGSCNAVDRTQRLRCRKSGAPDVWMARMGWLQVVDAFRKGSRPRQGPGRRGGVFDYLGGWPEAVRLQARRTRS